MINSFKPIIGTNKEDTNIFDVNTYTETSNIDLDYQILSYLNNLNEDYTSSVKTFYKSLSESNGESCVIHETYAEFFTVIKNLIEKFLKFIKTLFDNFVTKLSQLVQGDRAILKNQDKLRNYSIPFDTDGFNYSFDDMVPMIDAYEQINIPLVNNHTGKININIKNNKVSTDATKQAIDSVYDKFIAHIDRGYYDSFRGKVLRHDGSILEKDYNNECFKKYRSNATSPVTIVVDSIYISTAIDRIKNYKSFINSVQKTKEKIEDDYKKIINNLSTLIKPNSTEISSTLRNIEVTTDSGKPADIVISYDALMALNKYTKAVTRQIQEMMNIHSIAFTAKMTAIKDQYIQDRRILNRVLSKISNTTTNESTEITERQESLWIM